jgi:hypothetical protein
LTNGFFVSLFANAQKSDNNLDSTVIALKVYLLKSVRYPPVAKEHYMQGTMAVSIHLNKFKRIDSVYFARHIDKECDSLVLKILKSYNSSINLPKSIYTIGLRFLILNDGKPDSEIKPFNATIYENFLFELNVTTEIERRIYSVY